jgi:hypothetical protein
MAAGIFGMMWSLNHQNKSTTAHAFSSIWVYEAARRSDVMIMQVRLVLKGFRLKLIVNNSFGPCSRVGCFDGSIKYTH